MNYYLEKRCYSQLTFLRGGMNEAQNKKKNPKSSLKITSAKSTAFKRGVWSQLTTTWSNEKQKIAFYINGELLAKDRSLVPRDSQGAQGGLNIGSWNKDNFLNGTLDEINIYSRALSPEEVKAYYQKEKKQVN